MHIRGFVLGVALLASVGWCTVQECIKQTRARYRLAELARREDESEKRLERLRAREATLRSPARLAAFVRKNGSGLVALGPLPPADSRLYAGAKAPGRQPGEVRDADFARSREDETVDVADAGGW